MKKSQTNFLQMYRHLSIVSDQAISIQSIGTLQYKYLSPIEQRDMINIIKNLVYNGYIENNLKLTKIFILLIMYPLV